MRRRRFTVLLVAALTVLPAAALASWSASASGSGQARARSVDSPTNVAATALGSTSVRVSWSPPTGGAPPSSYTISQVSPAPGGTVCATSATSCDVTGLSPSTSYQFAVRSLVGNWSSAATSTSVSTPAATALSMVLSPTGNKTAGVAFDIRFSSSPALVGTHAVSWSGTLTAPNGSQPLLPTSLVFDSFGEVTATVTVYRAGSLTLGATVAGRTASVSVSVRAGSVSSLAFGTVTGFSCSGVTKGGTYAVGISALDAWANSGPFPQSVAVSVSRLGGDDGALLSGEPTALEIAALASPATTSGTFTYKADSGNNKDVALRATAGAVSADCTTLTS